MNVAPWPKWYNPSVAPGVRYMERACKVLGASIDEIRKPNRTRGYARRRFALAHVMRDSLGYTFPQIGLALGLDHSTVIHGVRRSKQLVETDPNHAKLVDVLEMAA